MKRRQPMCGKWRIGDSVAGRAVGLMMAVTTAAANSDWYVATNAQHTFDGQSWATAFTNVQQALDAAASNDEILLAGQTFSLTNQLVWTNAGVTVRGGYAATNAAETLGPRDPEMWPTVLLRPVESANNFRILHIDGADNSTLEGVSLTGGYAVQVDGGGLRIENSQGVLVSGCMIVSNTSFYSGAKQQGAGGGVYATSSSVTLTNCLVARNTSRNTYNNLGTAAHGGGVWSDGALTIRDCRLVYNDADAAYTGADSRAYYGLGGGVYFDGTSLAMKNVLVANNEASGGGSPYRRGDGIYLAGGAAELMNVTVVDHHTGEGLRQAGGTVALTNCIVWYNGSDIEGTAAADHSNIGDIDYGGNNISAAPLFEYGYYLATNSPCAGTGSDTAEDLGLDGHTTRADGTAYGAGDTVDMGWHYAAGADLTYADIYVSAAGSDGNDGTNWTQALRTLTKALTLAADGSRIHVATGTYSQATGETFPLAVEESLGLGIVGTNAAGTVIDADGASARVMALDYAHRAQVAGITLTGGYVTQEDGGGIRISNSGWVLLSGCHVATNTSYYTGAKQKGAGGGIHASASIVTVTNCTVTGNTSYNAYDNLGTAAHGGGIWSDGKLTVRDCQFSDNEATAVRAGTDDRAHFGLGGGVYFAGSVMVMKNVLLADNAASGGGSSFHAGDGVYVAAGSARLLNVTVAHNDGEGLRVADSAVAVTNAILWGNGDDCTGNVTIAWSCVSNSTDYVNGGNNISADPLFVDTGGGDYRLQPESPAAGAGIVQAWMAEATDLDGNPRLSGGKVDMGCYRIPAPSGTLFLVR